MSSQTCHTCDASNVKYKCPTCRAPRYVPEFDHFAFRTDQSSCSLPCFKQHESTCSASPKRIISSTVSNAPTTSEDTKPSTRIASLDAEDLKSLFKQYPSLKGRLQQIYLLTQEPSEAGWGEAREPNSRLFPAQPWRPEKGVQTGLKSLQAVLEGDGPDAEGIAAFMKLLSEKTSHES